MSHLTLDPIALADRVPIQQVFPRWLWKTHVELYMLRLDETDQHISGNKWFKLAKNVQHAQDQGHGTLLSFGGAFSNHIYSFSQACKRADLKSVAVIRGEELTATSNPMLEAVNKLGTELIFVDRENYRRKYETDRLDYYRSHVGDFFMIPEGGSNHQGVQGAEVIADVIAQQSVPFDHVVMACGTGATLAGVVRGFGEYPKAPVVHGLSMFGERSIDSRKGWLRADVARFVGEIDVSDYRLHALSDVPGYGRLSPELIQFGHGFLKETGILLDPVYTLKLMYFTKCAIEQGVFDRSKGRVRVLCLHTGGLHGWLGYLGESIPAQLSGTIKQRLLS